MQFTTSCNQKAQWSPAVKLIVWYTRLGLLCKYTWCCYIHSTKSQITKQHEFKPSPPSSLSRPIWRRLHRKKANLLKQLKHLLKRELHLNQRPRRLLPARITQKFPKEQETVVQVGTMSSLNGQNWTSWEQLWLTTWWIFVFKKSKFEAVTVRFFLRVFLFLQWTTVYKQTS